MKARFILACAAAAMATTALGTTASADNTFTGSIGFTPNVVEPGYEVEINGTCSDPRVTTARVSSEVLEPVTLVRRETIPDHDSRWVLAARTKVKAGVQPGQHKVSFKCGTTLVSGQLQVIPSRPLPRAAITVSPAKGVAGTKVSVRLLCSESAPVTSSALTIGGLKKLPDSKPDRPFFGATATVKNIKPGVYKVSAKCGAAPVSTTFTVVGSNSKAQVPVKPKGAAETGDLPDA